MDVQLLGKNSDSEGNPGLSKAHKLTVCLLATNCVLLVATLATVGVAMYEIRHAMDSDKNYLPNLMDAVYASTDPVTVKAVVDKVQSLSQQLSKLDYTLDEKQSYTRIQTCYDMDDQAACEAFRGDDGVSKCSWYPVYCTGLAQRKQDHEVITCRYYNYDYSGCYNAVGDKGGRCVYQVSSGQCVDMDHTNPMEIYHKFEYEVKIDNYTSDRIDDIMNSITTAASEISQSLAGSKSNGVKSPLDVATWLSTILSFDFAELAASIESTSAQLETVDWAKIVCQDNGDCSDVQAQLEVVFKAIQTFAAKIKDGNIHVPPQ